MNIDELELILPREWEIYDLNKLMINGVLGTNSLGNENKSGYPLIKMGNLNRGGINLTKIEYIDEDENEINQQYFLNEGDFLFNTRNTPDLVGKSAVWRGNIENAIYNGNLMKIILSELVNPYYLELYLANSIGWNQLRNIATGTTSVGAIYTKDFKKVKIVLPPLNEQKKIVEIAHKIDESIDNVNKQIFDLTELKKALAKKLLTEGIGHTEFKDSELGKIPVRWDVRELGTFLELLNGRAYKQNELLNEGKYRVLRVGNFFTNDSWYFSDLELEENKYCENGDLLYAWSASFGPRIWSGDKVIYHYHIWKIKVLEQMDKSFLYHMLMQDVDSIKKTTNGSAMVHVTKENMNKRKFALPSMEEQITIARILNNIDLNITQYQDQKLNYIKLKEGLMQQLLTGNLRVNLEN